MQIHIVNPSHVSFGIGVITPRWLYVIAAATPQEYGDPQITDETLQPLPLESVKAGDVVGIGIHTGNALRGYELGRQLRARGAQVIFGGIHASLYPQEARDLGGGHAVVRGDGDLAWPQALRDHTEGRLMPLYEGGRIEATRFLPARWDLLPAARYMWASVQTVRGCPKHCSFCSVWRTDGQRPRQRDVTPVVEEIVELRRRGFRFIALADDNFYPVSLEDLRLAYRQNDAQRISELETIRAERFELMARLAQLPADTVFFTQITMEAANDTEFLEAMRRAHIKGALVGIESVTPEGLKDVYKGFNSSGEDLVRCLRAFRAHDLHVLGSFIFGLPSDRAQTFAATLDLAKRAGVTFAQFLMLTPFPGTVDFNHWEQKMKDDPTRIAGFPLTRHWLIPQALRPKVYVPHPAMSADEIRVRTQETWDRFYSFQAIWKRSACVRSLRGRMAFVLISKLYRQMYANTGIATDSARLQSSARWATYLARPCLRLFRAKPLPFLNAPAASTPALTSDSIVQN